MRIQDFNPAIGAQIAFLQEKAALPSLWQVEAQRFCEAVAACPPDTDADAALGVMHDLQRLRAVFVAGLEHHADFRAAFDRVAPVSWAAFTSPPVADGLQQKLADRLYTNAAPTGADVAAVLLGNGARRVGALLVARCVAQGVPVVPQIADGNFSALVMHHADDAGVQALAANHLALLAPVTKRMVAVGGMEDGLPVARDVEKDRLFTKLTNAFSQRVMSGDVFSTLTIVPTRKDAEMDGIPFDDFVTLFFEMCDQPWDHIDKAQQHLIAQLDAGKVLRLTNDDGTDVTLSIDGFTFCNSLVARNVPGSEVFSAPAIDGVNGKIVAKGRFAPPHDHNVIIENLTMEFEKGRLVRWHAEKGQEHFEKAISIDDGAKGVGEIGIGTNAHLDRHVINGLLVEKIGGSFHVALGNAYTMTHYMGVPVHVDNGNRSAMHWDVTTMLRGKGGCMYVDGHKIMDNGRFLDPALDVLNRGWAALPESDRPDYWKKHPKVVANA